MRNDIAVTEYVNFSAICPLIARGHLACRKLILEADFGSGVPLLDRGQVSDQHLQSLQILVPVWCLMPG